MSTAIGRDAEDRVARYLEQQGYKIVSQNWRTRYCEIDIVASKQKVVWFVEVKYRSSTAQGAGYEYVTDKKLQQMRFAAEFWVQSEKWTGEYRLAVASVDDQAIEMIDDL
jgi:uncharacterized protein (TIGR00252 family)